MRQKYPFLSLNKLSEPQGSFFLYFCEITKMVWCRIALFKILTFFNGFFGAGIRFCTPKNESVSVYL